MLQVNLGNTAYTVWKIDITFWYLLNPTFNTLKIYILMY